MLKDKIALLVIDGNELCPYVIKEDCPKGISCKECLTSKILELCRKEIGEIFKGYEVTEFRKELIQKFNEKFAGFENVKTDMQKLRE